MTDLQDLVDGLASALGRPVGVDDRRLRSVAYSSHVDGIDPVRLASILQREAPAEVVRWLEELGIGHADPFLRVPPNPRFGMAARICVPLRFDGRLLGFLWLIDRPAPLSDPSLELALGASSDIAVAMYRMDEIEQSDRALERLLLRSSLGLDDVDPADAAAKLVSRGVLASAPSYAVLAVAPHQDSEPAPDLIRARVAAAVEHQRRFASARHFLVLVEPRRVYAVIASDGARGADRHADEISARVEANLTDCPGWSATVGVSAPHERRESLPAARREAELAGELAHRVNALGTVGAWNELGSYRTIALATSGKDPKALMPASLQRLLDHPERDALLPTLLAFLDLAGDASAAAKQLYVHRSSVYSRLHRLEDICEVELASGDARLELHLGLRLWQLAGEP